jgi:hypothetical protein
MESITHKYLRSLLSEGKIVTFTFTKKDGTDRTIRATTNISLIPKDKKPKFVKGRFASGIKSHPCGLVIGSSQFQLGFPRCLVILQAFLDNSSFGRHAEK